MSTLLQTSRILLKPASESDYPQLYKWRNSKLYLEMVSSRRSLVSYEKFVNEQKLDDSKRHMQFLIYASSNYAVAVGFIYSFNLNIADGYTFVNVYIDEMYIGKGYGVESGIIFSCYLFDFFPLHKICYETFEYNKPSLAMIKNVGLEKEGVFKEQKFCNGRYYNIYRFALFRSNQERVRLLCKRFLERKCTKKQS